MKKTIGFIIILIISIAILSFTSASASVSTDTDSPFSQTGFSKYHDLSRFDLPGSLEVIEDEAFKGIAIKYVVLPEKVTTIGEQAFADNPLLREIRIPMATTSIAKTAFSGSTQVTITAAADSYAKAWAKENRFPFSPITTVHALNMSVQVTGLANGSEEEQNFTVNHGLTDNRTEQPTSRMNGEINADRYETITAFHILGRSPPMG